MMGYACTQFKPDPWVTTVTVQFVGPVVNIEFGDLTRCTPNPQIDRRKPNNPQLVWGGGDQGCLVMWSIHNKLQRDATFGAVQILFTDNFYIKINGHSFLVVNNPNAPFLDSEKETPFVRTTISLAPEEGDVLELTDSPSLPLGSGCWRSPKFNGQYTEAGFLVEFKAFVLQDWDSSDANIQQTPIGGNTVVSWLNQAEAYLDNQNQWQINEGMTRLIQPFALNVPLAYEPFWNGWVGDEKYEMATLNKDGCYYLAADPQPASGF